MNDHPEPAEDRLDVLGLTRPTSTLRRGMLFATAAAAALAFMVFLAVGPALPSIVTAVPAVVTFAIVAGIASAWLLQVYDEIDHDPALCWMVAGILVAAVGLGLVVLGFPTLLPDGGPLGTGPSEVAALYLTWKTVLATMAILALSPVAADQRWRRGVIAVALTVTFVAAWGDAGPGVLVEPDGQYSLRFRGLLTVVTVLTAIATWRWVAAAGRHPSWPRAWVTVSLGLQTWDLVLYSFAERRFSIAWWASLGIRLAAFATLALGLLAGLRRVFRTLDHFADEIADVAQERARAADHLAAANDELQAFAHVVAHDLRSPLTSASGFVDLARSLPDDLPPDVADFLDRASIQHRRMASLITDLLEYAEVANADLQREWVDLTELGREVVRERGAEEVATIEPLPAILGDRIRLRQLLDNLVGNAIKYVPPGVEPHLRLWSEELGSGTYAVHVDDNGIGIDPERAEEIFRPFVRTSDARAGYPGTGIGLAICQRVVEQHAGEISAAPRPGGGTRFTFTLPRTAPPAPPVVDGPSTAAVKQADVQPG
ncbi:ATP-binding protein [Egicoccus sp. AB-alg6-2]|uniref:sensor histidine kinase n=1 Tax=Egicoccus sp. AB-alg6-2 TaxID=3242692 RepID=UPI00359D1867